MADKYIAYVGMVEFEEEFESEASAIKAIKKYVRHYYVPRECDKDKSVTIVGLITRKEDKEDTDTVNYINVYIQAVGNEIKDCCAVRVSDNLVNSTWDDYRFA